MIWLTWRQQRTEALIMAAVLAVLATILLITGVEMANTFQQSGLATCLAQATDRTRCSPLEDAFANQFGPILNSVSFLSILPALLGALVGGPLVARELEQRTHLLAWTQSVTRFHWLTVKLALTLGAGLVASGALMALLIWWHEPADQVYGHFSATSFDFSGPVWLAASIMALALGVFAGTLSRRVIVAIFLALVLFLAIRLPVEFYLRPNYQPPITVTWPLGQSKAPTLSNQDWLISSGWIDAHGNKTNRLRCTVNQTLDQCMASQGYTAHYETYQPADRFWTFQWIETGIYLVVSALALGATAWLIRRRIV